MAKLRSSQSRQEEGSILIEALILVALILLTAVSLAQILPLQFSFQRSSEDRAKVQDRQDSLISFANTWVAPAYLPLMDVDGDGTQVGFSVTYQAPDEPAPVASTADVCYNLTLNLTTDIVRLSWLAPEPNGLCAQDFSGATILKEWANVVNTPERPLFIYYNDSSSEPIANPETPVASCNLPAPDLDPLASVTATPGAPDGVYVYAVSFLRAEGETPLGPESGPVDATGGFTVEMTSLPVGPVGTTARRIYRSPSSAAPRTWRLALEVTNNDEIPIPTPVDNISDAAIATAAEPAPVPLAAGRCASSVGLQIDIDEPDDRVFFDTRRYRVLFSNALTTAQLANGAVTAQELASDTLNIAKIADGSLGPAALASGLATQYEQMSLTNLNTANYGPSVSGEIGKWRYNTTSTAVGSLTAGAAERAALVLDWSSYCRAGQRLEARGRYTIYSPTSTVSVAARLLSFADATSTNPASGGPFAATASQSIPAGTYKTLVSGWDIVDLGRCNAGNYLLAQNYFLYLIQTQASAQQPYTVTNALLELRWVPEEDPSGNEGPYTPQQLAPAADAAVNSGPGAANYLTLSARFLDPDVLDRGRLRFELCADDACASPLGSGETHTVRNSIANGGRGEWTYTQPLASGQVYYWRVRGEDRNGNLGPWSATARLTT